MRLDNLIQTMLPHDEQFYVFFKEAIGYTCQASELLLKIPSADPAERQRLTDQIGDIEDQGDDVTHKIFGELNSTFVTPFDPEDIHKLASELDDVLDNIDGSARRVMLYKIRKFSPDMITLMEILHKANLELKEGISLLQGFKNPQKLQEVIIRVHDYESQADQAFARAVAELFDNEKDPIEIIKMKEILVQIETATDKCEDVANVIETIIIKHA